MPTAKKKVDTAALDWLQSVLNGNPQQFNMVEDAKATMQSKPVITKKSAPVDFKQKEEAAMKKLADLPDPIKYDDYVSKQPLNVIEAAPIVLNEGAIKKRDLPANQIEDFSRENYNELLDSQFEHTDSNKALAEAEMGKKNQYRDINEKMFLGNLKRANQSVDIAPERSNFDATAYQQAIKAKLDSLDKRPQDIPEIDKIMAAFLPVAGALAAGGSAGAYAGGKAFEVGQKDLADRRKIMTEDRQSKSINLGRELQGVAELRKAENDQKKNEMDAQKYNLDRQDKFWDKAGQYAQFLFTSGQKDSQQSRDAFEKTWSEGNKIQESGIKSSVDISENEDKQAFQADQAALDRASAEKRAEIGAKSAEARARIPRPMMQRPPTEGMTSSANAYAAMSKAGQAYDRMLKDLKSPPSLSSKWYDVQKSVFENSSGATLMGTVIRNIPDPGMRRQIQVELDWLAPKLRKDSGAAISVGEYLAEGNRYFPRAGDDATTIYEKEASRRQAVENYKLGAGSAPLPSIQQPIEQKIIDGVRYQKAKGGWKKVK